MSRSAHRVLGNSRVWSEDPTDAIDPRPIARRGHDDGPGAERHDLRQVGLETPDGGRIVELDERVLATQSVPANTGEAQGRRKRRFGWWVSGKVHLDPVIIHRSTDQQAASGVEPARTAKNVSGREGRMSTQFDLDAGREPSEIVFTVGSPDHEGCLGEVHLSRHGPHADVGRERIEDGHRRGVPGERFGSEGIDNREFHRHRHQPKRRASPDSPNWPTARDEGRERQPSGDRRGECVACSFHRLRGRHRVQVADQRRPRRSAGRRGRHRRSFGVAEAGQLARTTSADGSGPSGLVEWQ